MNKLRLLLALTLLASLSFLSFKDVYVPKFKMANDRVIKRDDGALYMKGMINIKFKNTLSGFSAKTFGISELDNGLSAYNITKLEQRHPLRPDVSKRLPTDENLSRIFAVYYEGAIDPSELSQIIMDGNKDILDWAEPDFVMESDFTPNDPSVGSQYHIGRIMGYAAWDLCQGDTNVVIGLVDSGSDLDHPDLAANIKYNYLENPTNGIDDDNNGYVDDWRGWDFAGADYHALSEDNNPNIVSSYCEHGSHVSGDAAEVTNNGIGGAGIGFKCKLLISKHGADNDNTGGGYSYVYNTNAGLVYCYQNGAKVINCSFGSTSPSAYTQLVINDAWAAGVVTCASAGNDGANVPRYPASYENVVSVASTTSSDVKSYFSNFHSTVDVCAPGSSIYSTLFNNSYAVFDGTSMSSPICAGTVALIRSKFPSYTPDQVVTKLKTSCDSIYNLNPSYVGLLGTGRINAYKSLLGATGITNTEEKIPAKYSLSQNFPNPFNPSTKIKFGITNGSNVRISVFDITGRELAVPVNEFLKAGTYTYSFDGSKLTSGIYFYRITSGNFMDTRKMMLVK